MKRNEGRSGGTPPSRVEQLLQRATRLQEESRALQEALNSAVRGLVASLPTLPGLRVAHGERLVNGRLKRRAVRVLIVTDHPIMRLGLAACFTNERKHFQICAFANTIHDALEMVGAYKPNLAIIDVSPPSKNQISQIKELHSLWPDFPTLVISTQEDQFFAERALRAGAKGYLMEQAGCSALLEAVRRIAAGQIYLRDDIKDTLLENLFADRMRGESPLHALSDREFEILQLTGQGKSNAAIASTLGISGKTVAVHRNNLKRKLRIRSGTELIQFAVRWVESQQPDNLIPRPGGATTSIVRRRPRSKG